MVVATWAEEVAKVPEALPPTSGSHYPVNYDIPEPWFRDILDQTRSMYRATPESQHPDGYLGTTRTRRDDRLLRSLDNLNRRQYTRGVHRGERRDFDDYIWPDEFNTMTGIQRQATTGLRHAPAVEKTPVTTARSPYFAPMGMLAPQWR